MSLFSLTPLTTASSSKFHPLFHSDPPLLWFVPYLRGSAPHSAGSLWGPDPTTHWTELAASSSTAGLLASGCFDAEKRTANALPLILWWASLSTQCPSPFLSQKPARSQAFCKASLGPLHLQWQWWENELSETWWAKEYDIFFCPPGTVLFLTQRGVCWQFPTHRRMASKGPLVQIILTDFFLKWEEKPWQHGLKCSRGVTTTFWVTPSVGRL